MDPLSYEQWALQLEGARRHHVTSVNNAPEEIPLTDGQLGKSIFKVLSIPEVKLFSKCLPPRNQGLPTIFHCLGSNSNLDFIKIY